MKISALQLKKLKTAALAAQAHAYAPYSRFQVGSAILLKSGEIFSGCNIENASYGATVCAERVATWKALSEGDRSELIAVFVVVNSPKAWPPCGLCRQVLMEFAHPQALVYCLGLNQKIERFKLASLMPKSFGPKALKA